MSYIQVKDFMDYARKSHRRFRDAAVDVCSGPDDQCGAVLTFIKDEEREMDAALRQYEAQSADGIGETWLQYLPDEDLQNLLESIEEAGEVSAQDLLDFKRQFDTTMAQLYSQAANQVHAPRVREMFESMSTWLKRRREQEGWRNLELTEGEPPPTTHQTPTTHQSRGQS